MSYGRQLLPFGHTTTRRYRCVMNPMSCHHQETYFYSVFSDFGKDANAIYYTIYHSWLTGWLHGYALHRQNENYWAVYFAMEVCHWRGPTATDLKQAEWLEVGRTNGNQPLTSDLAMRPKKKTLIIHNPYQKTTFTIYLLHISFLHSRCKKMPNYMKGP